VLLRVVVQLFHLQQVSFFMNKMRSIRLYVDQSLGEGQEVVCVKGQINYLLNVLRLDDGDHIRVFNGRDGEWDARLIRSGKRSLSLCLEALLRAQTTGPDIQYIFAPLKRTRLDYMVQKAVELGVSRLSPVLTHHCQVERVNMDRMRANAIEAAEQCGILQIPEFDNLVKLLDLINVWDETRAFVFCDEKSENRAGNPGPVATLKTLAGQKISVLIGPEGGFSQEERDLLCSTRFVTPLSLGPRILRGDTAAVAALSLVNGVIGDWN